MPLQWELVSNPDGSGTALKFSENWYIGIAPDGHKEGYQLSLRNEPVYWFAESKGDLVYRYAVYECLVLRLTSALVDSMILAIIIWLSI